MQVSEGVLKNSKYSFDGRSIAIVAMLREAGMSTRAIAATVNAHQETVVNDLKNANGFRSPAPPVKGSRRVIRRAQDNVVHFEETLSVYTIELLSGFPAVLWVLTAYYDRYQTRATITRIQKLKFSLPRQGH